MNHRMQFKEGSDARNHVVGCECGWRYSGTYRAIRDRAMTHSAVFMDEDRAWNDPRRRAQMPGNHGDCR
jgi:hypothetical protein